MILWSHWLSVVLQLRSSCSRTRTFLWFITSMAGMTVRIDILGVTSIVRARGLEGFCYDRILDDSKTPQSIFPIRPLTSGETLGMRVPRAPGLLPEGAGGG